MDSSCKRPNSLMSSSQSASQDNLYNLVSVPSNMLPFQFNLNPPASSIIIPGTAMVIPPIAHHGVVGGEKKTETITNNSNCKIKDSSKNGKDRNNRKPDDARTYKCNKCSRSYLSYPALYTHTKLKHMYMGENSSITNGRMRGRPRKFQV